jgi:hypothetical protein
MGLNRSGRRKIASDLILRPVERAYGAPLDSSVKHLGGRFKVSDTSETNNHRAEIALRNRRRALESRERKLSMTVYGLMAYSAFANGVSGILLLGTSLADAWLGIGLGALYALGVYLVWAKDDTRWWPVAVPAGISIVAALMAWFGGVPHPIPLLLNIVLLILVPIRKRAVAAVPNHSLKAEA